MHTLHNFDTKVFSNFVKRTWTCIIAITYVTIQTLKHILNFVENFDDQTRSICDEMPTGILKNPQGLSSNEIKK